MKQLFRASELLPVTDRLWPSFRLLSGVSIARLRDWVKYSTGDWEKPAVT
jgi:hypothetical protein